MSKRHDTLIIEDDDATRLLIQSVAEKLGHSAVGAPDGESGLEEWRTGRHPLVILDLNLPEISGADVCQKIREQSEDCFVLICTSDARIETLKAILAAGANDYLPKPLDSQMLAIRLEVARSQMDHIRKKKEFESEVHKSERRFRLISENSRDLVCTHSPTGEFTYVSPSCRNLLGIEPQDLIGRSFEDFKMDKSDEPINLHCGEDEENGQFESTKIWRAKTTDSHIWLETYTQATRDEQNQLAEIYSYSRDVTEQKNEEQQLKILSVLGEGSDSETFLRSMIKEMEEKLNATVILHVAGIAGERPSYCIHTENMSAETVALHQQLNKTTQHEKQLFQGRMAGNVFNTLPNSENIEAVITQPVLSIYGRPIAKLTIISERAIPESERTKAILTLCATKMGCALEEHATR